MATDVFSDMVQLANDLGAEGLQSWWDKDLKVWRAECSYDGTKCEGRGSDQVLSVSAMVNSMKMLIAQHAEGLER